MNISDILQKAHSNILEVTTSTLTLDALSEEVAHIEETLSDATIAASSIPLHRKRLANLRGHLTNMILQLDKLEASLEQDKDTLLRQLFIAKRGVTHIAINPQPFSAKPIRRSAAPGQPNRPRPPQKSEADRAMAKLSAQLQKNPQLLAQLQAKLSNSLGSSTLTTASTPSEEPNQQ